MGGFRMQKSLGFMFSGSPYVFQTASWLSGTVRLLKLLRSKIQQHFTAGNALFWGGNRMKRVFPYLPIVWQHFVQCAVIQRFIP